MQWIKEERLMLILLWLSPFLGGTLSTIYMVENVVQENSFAFFFSYCRKTSFDPEMISKLVVSNSLVFITTMSIICEFLAHILIFSKKTSIESRAQVYEIRGNRMVCELRHQRNVVSVLGHFLSFAITLIQLIIFAVGVYTLKESILTLAKLNAFHNPCINFFIHPLIETLSTHNIRQSLLSIT